jgi:hypothetical protein
MVSNQKQDIEDGRERAKNLCPPSRTQKEARTEKLPHTHSASRKNRKKICFFCLHGLVLSDHAFRFEETTFSPMGGFVRSSQKNAHLQVPRKRDVGLARGREV